MRIFKKLLVVSIMFGLITFNILTLLNDDIHAATFNALKAVIASIVVDETLSRLLSHSSMQKYNAIEARNIELRRVSVKRANTAKRISTRIAYRAERHAVKSASSFLPKITPIIGSAITATLTIMEINDDCQTLQDLNELNVDFELEKKDENTVCGMDITFLNDYTTE